MKPWRVVGMLAVGWLASCSGSTSTGTSPAGTGADGGNGATTGGTGAITHGGVQQSPAVSCADEGEDAGQAADSAGLICSCTASAVPAGDVSGTPTYSGVACGEEFNGDGLAYLCCADPAYPNDGSCDCSLAFRWACQATATSCVCGYVSADAGVVANTTCATTAASGTYDVCCAGLDDASCVCGNGITCDQISMSTAVDSCTAPTDPLTFRTYCPAGKQTVTTCAPALPTPTPVVVDSGTGTKPPPGGGGGGGTVTTCNGTPHECSYHVTEGDCQTSGCTWQSHCTGTPESCASFDLVESSCEEQPGCYYDEGNCEGSASGCSSEDDSSSCTRVQGCTWSSGCGGAPGSCSTHAAGSSACNAAGCQTN